MFDWVQSMQSQNLVDGSVQSNRSNQSGDSMKRKLMVLALALSVSVPVGAFAASWGAIAVDDEVGERSPAYGVGGRQFQG